MNRGSYNVKWTEGDVTRLRILVEQGCSGGVIAGYMNRTRNQVIGKAWRLGLRFTAKITNTPGRRRAEGPLTVDEICRIMEVA